MREFGIRRSQQPQGEEHELIKPQTAEEHELTGKEVLECCLLYTSDAADEV